MPYLTGPFIVKMQKLLNIQQKLYDYMDEEELLHKKLIKKYNQKSAEEYILNLHQQMILNNEKVRTVASLKKDITALKGKKGNVLGGTNHQLSVQNAIAQKWLSVNNQEKKARFNRLRSRQAAR
jgi:hypothetical protein